MRRSLIDTNIYVAFKRNDPLVVKTFRSLDLIGVDVCVLAELYSGFRLGSRFEQNNDELLQFINNPRVRVYSHDIETAEFYSYVYANLRKKGTPIPTNDMWIAAVAKQHGLAIYSKDQHFKLVEGLIYL